MELAQYQTSIACEQPTILPERPLDQRLVRNDFVVGGVVAENAEPVREATEHRIGKEGKGSRWLKGDIAHERLSRSERWEVGSRSFQPTPVRIFHGTPFDRQEARSFDENVLALAERLIRFT